MGGGSEDKHPRKTAQEGETNQQQTLDFSITPSLSHFPVLPFPSRENSEGDELPPAEQPEAGEKQDLFWDCCKGGEGQESPVERLDGVPTTETPGSSSQEHGRFPEPQHPLALDLGVKISGGKTPQ